MRDFKQRRLKGWLWLKLHTAHAQFLTFLYCANDNKHFESRNWCCSKTVYYYYNAWYAIQEFRFALYYYRYPLECFASTVAVPKSLILKDQRPMSKHSLTALTNPVTSSVTYSHTQSWMRPCTTSTQCLVTWQNKLKCSEFVMALQE